MQMLDAAETLRVNFVDVLGARRTRREPSTFRDHFDPTDWSTVARRLGQRGDDLLAGEFALLELLRREPRQNLLLRWRGGRVDPLINRRAKLMRQLLVQFPRIVPRARGHLG